MTRRRMSLLLGAAIAGLMSGSRVGVRGAAAEEARGPKHVCKGLNQCKGQGQCKHGCSGHGCSGKNDCKGKGGSAAEAAQHSCKGANTCKQIGGCASGDRGCAGRNSCKGKGGCEVPLKVEHAKVREQAAKAR